MVKFNSVSTPRMHLPREKHTAVLTSLFVFNIINPSESLVLPGNLSVFPWSSRSPILSNFSAHQNQLGELKTI